MVHNHSIFEALMLVCFGASWPFAVWKTYRAKRGEGKSLRFLVLILLGYLSGTLHKIFYSFDYVIFLYIANALMVLTDLLLLIRYRKRDSSNTEPLCVE